MIRVVDLYKSFGSQRVLAGVNLEIPDGTICVGQELFAQTSYWPVTA